MLGPSPTFRLATAAAGLLLAAGVTRAEAQVRPNWEFEFHGTFVMAATAPTGPSNRPAAGPTFMLGDAITTSRIVPSWFFGDGAELLNGVMQARGLAPRIVLLDQSSWPEASRLAGPQAGFRLARRAAGPLWLEFSLDLGFDTLGFDQGALDKIEATRASFVTAFTALANSTATLLPNPDVTSTATISRGGRRASASAVFQLRGGGRRTVPIVMAGAGYNVNLGSPTRLTLQGNYRFMTPSQGVIDETDTTSLEYQSEGGLFLVAGFGLTQALSAGSGIRVDVRGYFADTTVTARLFTNPASGATASGSAAILNSTNPGLQFSSINLPTNLSGTAWNGFEAYSGTARAIQWVASIGYYIRF